MFDVAVAVSVSVFLTWTSAGLAATVTWKLGIGAFAACAGVDNTVENNSSNKAPRIQSIGSPDCWCKYHFSQMCAYLTAIQLSNDLRGGAVAKYMMVN